MWKIVQNLARGFWLEARHSYLLGSGRAAPRTPLGGAVFGRLWGLFFSVLFSFFFSNVVAQGFVEEFG